MTAAWGGRRTMNLRAKWRRLIDQGGIACSRCGVELEPAMPFDLDHLQARDYGGSVWDRDNVWPAHPRCNRAAGQRITTAKRRARARRRAPPTEPSVW